MDAVLADMKLRFAPGWPAFFEVGAGWLPVVARLHQAMVAVEPNYQLLQVKQKFAELRVYFESPPLECCAVFDSPDSADDVVSDAYEEHLDAPEHVAAEAQAQLRQKLLSELVEAAGHVAGGLCELTGVPGLPMTSGYWVRVIDPVAAGSGYQLVPFNVDFSRRLAANDPVKLNVLLDRSLERVARLESALTDLRRIQARLRSDPPPEAPEGAGG